MENLENLVKVKEAEIEKLNDIRNALKRKVIELSDTISLKDMKIQTYGEEIEQLRKTIAELEQKDHAPPSDSLNSIESTDLMSSPIFSEILAKFEELCQEIKSKYSHLETQNEKIQQQLSTLSDGSFSKPARDQSSEITHHKLTSAPIELKKENTLKMSVSQSTNEEDIPSGSHRARLRHVSQDDEHEEPSSSKSKIMPPIVSMKNIGKIQSTETSYTSEDQIPPPPSSRSRAIPPPPSITRNVEYNDVPSPSKPSSMSAPKVSAGTFGLETIEYPADGVIKCPACGSQNFREMENKKKILMHNPLKYGKKYGCKDCRKEWDYIY